VQIPRVGGEPSTVSFEFKYMDRPTLAAMYDRWNAAREDLFKSAKESENGLSQVTADEIEQQTAELLDIVAGWSFDDAFTPEAAKALATTLVGAPRAVIAAYQAAYEPARLGN
jgi:hypothetical protein